MMDLADIEMNLLNGWHMTNDVQRQRGRDWYPMAHDFASVIGHGNVVIGAGLLAATSPNKGWNDNRRIAVLASQGVFAGQVTNALDKARRIMDGEDPDTVLPRGKKTWHFYHNILDPSAPEYVTVDRHAIRAATWEWDNGEPRVTPKNYSLIATGYANVARDVGINASDLQAGLWIWARER
jgi:hypothetical protein